MTYPNWFKQIAQHNFEEFLLPEAGKPNLRYLQLGVFTGDASVWLLDNVLTGKQAKLIDVDSWLGAPNEPIQEQMNFADVFNTYLDKVGNGTIWHRETTFQFLTSTVNKYKEGYYADGDYVDWHFDFIYVDAHHTSASAFLDCELSWPLLKSGGLMAIDDYEWQHPDGVEIHAPKLGIHMFLDRHEGEFDTLKVNQQYWLRKR